MPGKLGSPGEPFDVGEYHFEPIGDREEEGRTIVKKVESVGLAHVIRVTGPDGVDLDVADVHWHADEREIRVISRHESPQKYDHLVRRRRIGIYGHLTRGRPDMSTWSWDRRFG